MNKEMQKVLKALPKYPVNSDVCVSTRDWEIEEFVGEIVFVLLEVYSEKRIFRSTSFRVDLITYAQRIDLDTDFINIDVLFIKRIIPDAFKMNITVLDWEQTIIRQKKDLLMDFNN